MIRRKEKEEEK